MPILTVQPHFQVGWCGMSDTDRECVRNLPMEDWKNLAEQIKVSIVGLSDFLDGRQFCLVCTAASGDNIPLIVRRVMLDIDNGLSIVLAQSQTVQHLVLRRICQGGVHIRVLAWFINCSAVPKITQIIALALPLRLLAHFVSVPALGREVTLDVRVDVAPALIANVRRTNSVAAGDAAAREVAERVVEIFEGMLIVGKGLFLRVWKKGALGLLGDILHGLHCRDCWIYAMVIGIHGIGQTSWPIYCNG